MIVATLRTTDSLTDKHYHEPIHLAYEVNCGTNFQTLDVEGKRGQRLHPDPPVVPQLAPVHLEIGGASYDLARHNPTPPGNSYPGTFQSVTLPFGEELCIGELRAPTSGHMVGKDELCQICPHQLACTNGNQQKFTQTIYDQLVRARLEGEQPNGHP
jgi:hypothetical protein